MELGIPLVCPMRYKAQERVSEPVPSIGTPNSEILLKL